MTTVLVTGATRGLGLAVARAAALDDAVVLVAGRSGAACAAVAREIGGTPVVVDLARLADVERAAAALPHVDVVVCNAGLQFTGAGERTEDGFEATFQVNHLAHLLLVDLLLAREAPPGRILFVGSGTHDPAQPTGMPAPLMGSVAEMSRPGEGSGRARYSTSKLLNTTTAAGLARERPDVLVACFDPGLMPGTGLARDHAGPARLLWRTLLLGLVVLPFASSPSRSGAVLARLAVEEPAPFASGALVDHRARVIAPSARAATPAFQDAVLRDSRALLAARRGAASA